MTSTESATTATGVSPELLDRIALRAFAQTTYMIHVANNRKDKEKGDPKVGGHPASCASSLHILTALHAKVRRVDDYICCKPHAAPLDHALHNLLDLFREPETTNWFDEERGKAAMYCLRKFASAETPDVFQSYHARSDADSFHILPSGSVGIPPVASVYLALAHRYARDHGYEVPEHAHFWSLIGDSEFREGSLLEALPDAAERMLGNVTWIIDYNRQNLDGTRIPNERGLESTDWQRIGNTAVANGWRVIQLHHGKFRKSLFEREGGDALQRIFEGSLSDYTYQLLLYLNNANEIRNHCAKAEPDSLVLLESLSDEEVLRAFRDLGGHCSESIVEALEASRKEDDEPYMIVAHTIKGLGLESVAHPANHSALPSKSEVETLLKEQGLELEDPFARFPEDSEEGRFCQERRDEFRAGIAAHMELRERNRSKVRSEIESGGGIPESIGIDLSLFPMAHTQWMWGQLASKLIRIGSPSASEDTGPRTELTENELRWQTAARFLLTMSPDVGTSTNISPAMDNRIYGPDATNPQTESLEIDFKHPELPSSADSRTRHIRFEIAEANAMSAVASFGKMAHYCGLPFFPIMTVYDFFIKRALDQLYYNLYWNAEFVILGTPSGVTLSPEGAQHSWKSDIQIPNLITWEPLFALEVDWILSDAIRRQMMDENEGRRGVLIRAVTRGIPQKYLLENLKRQVRFKQLGNVTAALKPKDSKDPGVDWGDAIDESSVPAQSDAEILDQVRRDCLDGAYHFVDWNGYAGYEPGDNVVNVFALGSVATEALQASKDLLERGVFANVIVVSSPELLLGILGEQDEYRHLTEGLGITGDLHVTAADGTSQAELLSIAGRRVPCVAVCDGEAGLLDNIGSVLGVKQQTLAVRKFSKCGRPAEVFGYQGLDARAIREACGKVLSLTALENLSVSPQVLARLSGQVSAPRTSWRELWPDREQ